MGLSAQYIKIDQKDHDRGFEVMIPCRKMEAGIVLTVCGGTAAGYRVVKSRLNDCTVYVKVKGLLLCFTRTLKTCAVRVRRAVKRLVLVPSVPLRLSNGGGLRL